MTETAHNITQALTTSLIGLSNQELRDKYQNLHIENEEFVPVIWRGIIFPRYTISKYGNIIGPAGKKLLWGKRDNRFTGIKANVNLRTTDILIEDGFEYTKYKQITMQVHRLVAETFLTFPEHLPEALKEDWKVISKVTQNIIQDCLQVDHKDGNPWNPRWDNLEWMPPKDNTRRWQAMRHD